MNNQLEGNKRLCKRPKIRGEKYNRYRLKGGGIKAKPGPMSVTGNQYSGGGGGASFISLWISPWILNFTIYVRDKW